MTFGQNETRRTVMNEHSEAIIRLNKRLKALCFAKEVGQDAYKFFLPKGYLLNYHEFVFEFTNWLFMKINEKEKSDEK